MTAPAQRILLVDDKAPVRDAVGRTLRQHGFEVHEAASGSEALELAFSKEPDLILLDVQLPDTTGFDLTARLKNSERTRHIPILQLTGGFNHQSAHAEGGHDGADAYLVEPVNPRELVTNIRTLLRMRAAEAGLQRTTALLAAVVDASPLAIAVFDSQGVIRTWNRAAEGLFRVTSEAVIGQPAANADLSLFTDQALIRPLERGEPVTGLEWPTRLKDGTPLELLVFAAPLESSSAPTYVALIEDISARKDYERERAELLARERDARKDAERANRSKDEFLATLSHELRTPLNAILGWTNMLQQRDLDAAGRARALEVIERNARSQQQLVGDILEVSKIVRGQLRLDMRLVNVIDTVRAALESVAPTIEAKRLTLIERLPADPLTVWGDPERLQQIFWNLLSNALKYTPREGRITVSATDDVHEVTIRIQDTGIGIAPEVLPHIFERFRQGEAGPSREFGGLGLGLAIVRHLTEAHGGSVAARSEGTGRGAAFDVILPLAV